MEGMTTMAEILPKTFPDPEWVLEKLKAYDTNQWVEPRGDDFSLFQDLFNDHLCEKWTIPVWSNGSFKGTKVLFKYNHSLFFGTTTPTIEAGPACKKCSDFGWIDNEDGTRTTCLCHIE